MEGVPTKILGRATLIDRKKLSLTIGPRERGLLFNEEKRRDSKIVVLLRIKSKVTLVHEMAREAPLLLAERYPLFEDMHMKTFKKSKDGEGSNEYFTNVDDRLLLTSKPARSLLLMIKSWCLKVNPTSLLTHSHSMYPLWRAVILTETHAHASRMQNEWISS